MEEEPARQAREALLEQIQKDIGNVTPHFWAACQICDLGALGKIAVTAPCFTQGLGNLTRDMVRHWGPYPKYERSSDPSPSTPPPKRQKILDSPKALGRDTDAGKQAEARDSSKCVLTGIVTIEVAHIYPHHSIKQKEDDKGGPRHTFWRTLRAFWPAEKVDSWEAQLFPDGIKEKGSEQVYTLISLAPTVHVIWGRGQFALKPISESVDKKTLTVQFFWQKKQVVVGPRMSLTTVPNPTRDLEETAGTWLFDKNGKKIKSADCFDIQTDDTIERPLPSFELLELQWFLHRIQGMAGVVDTDIDWDTDWGYANSDSDADTEEPDNDVEDYSLPT